jgi:hypothetical protein
MKIVTVCVALILTFMVVGCSKAREATLIPVDPREPFAQCLTDRGAKLYSAHWCGYCRRQAELFGQAAFMRLRHVECEPTGTRGRIPECAEARITSYPTWVFGDGTRQEGYMTLEELSAASGCPWTPATR